MQIDVADAIRRGDAAALEEYLMANPGAPMQRLDGQRTLLHVATDWPGHFPNVRKTIELLAASGADLNARFHGGEHGETALHWAASSNDLEALDALLDLGANIESAGSVIDGATPLSDAVAFAQWRAAHRLIERGARTALWHAAATGMIDRVRTFFTADAKPSVREVTNAFWNACHGGQLEAAQYLRDRGAEVSWIGHSGLTPLDAAHKNGNKPLLKWLREQGAISAHGRRSPSS